MHDCHSEFIFATAMCGIEDSGQVSLAVVTLVTACVAFARNIFPKPTTLDRTPTR